MHTCVHTYTHWAHRCMESMLNQELLHNNLVSVYTISRIILLHFTVDNESQQNADTNDDDDAISIGSRIGLKVCDCLLYANLYI